MHLGQQAVKARVAPGPIKGGVVMVRPRVAIWTLVALVAGAVALAPLHGGIKTADAAAIAFETPTIVDPIHTNGEPDTAIDPQGRVFNSGPTGTGTQRSTWFGSVDGGHTFRGMTQKIPASPAVGIPAPGPGGGDTDIAFDRSGRQYFADLWALACQRVAVTGPTNPGATDQENFLGCAASGPGSDRQWFAVYDPAPGTPNQSAYTGPRPLVYLAWNNLVGPGPNGGEKWNKSTDGFIYTNATGGELPPDNGTIYSPFGGDGYPAIDQVTGKVFQAAGCDDKTCGTSKAKTAKPGLYMNIGKPDTTGVLHFLDATGTGQDLTKLIKIADTAGSPDVLFSVLSMDSARNLVAVWAVSGTPKQRQIFVSASSAASGWTKWTQPAQVSDASTTTGDATNVFPWIKAGGPGRADAVWYGSNLQVDPSSHNNQAWNVFMSQVVFPTNSSGGVTGGPPAMQLVKVTPHPMHYDDVCLQGSACIASQGNRNLADFFVITIDNSGAAEIVYDDTSNRLVQPPGTCTVQVADHCGAGVITIARQSSGPGLFGTNVSGPSNAPTIGITDNFGDALFPVIGGTNVPGMDILSNSIGLSGKTLTLTTRVVDLSNPAATAAKITGTAFLQYVTRWQMGNTIYYGAMENTALNRPIFYAGAAQSVDLCSVSACFPHVITYPEPGLGGSAENGSIKCPSAPSASNPCTLTINVNVANVGNPTSSSLLEIGRAHV